MPLKASKIFFYLATASLAAFAAAPLVLAGNNLAAKLNGRILLQVEGSGQAWYVNPADQKRYYLSDPAQGFALIKKFALGISDSDLKKIPLGLLAYGGPDGDRDGLPDNLEIALGANPALADSDSDGYDDRTEIINHYDPLSSGKLKLDGNLGRALSGKILLQAQGRGELWYVNPADRQKYYLGKGEDLWLLIKKIGLGITNSRLAEINFSDLSSSSPSPSSYIPKENEAGSKDVFVAAAQEIMAGNKKEALSFFAPEAQTAAEYTLDFLNAEGKFNLGNLMSGAKLARSEENEKIYTITVQLDQWKTEYEFYLKKQTDGSWKLANL